MIIVPSPVIVMHPQSQHTDLTEVAAFACNAIGYNISYYWTIGSGSFPNKVIGVYSSTLVIPDVRSSDDNTYACVATNEGGSVTSNGAHLIIKGMFSQYNITIDSTENKLSMILLS